MRDEIARFVEPVYRFCLHRLSSHADAEDLSQDILLCVLQGLQHTEVRHLDGYVWKIAHNRYAKRIGLQKKEAEILCGEEYRMDVPEAFDHGEEDEYQKVFQALHTLSAMYRDMMVDYYVRGLDVRAISARRGVTPETVKWRLHIGREKLKERLPAMERTYERIRMHVMCNGSFDSEQYLNSQLYKAIAKACYEQPLTMEEISLATGIPTLYLEDALDHLIGGDAIEQLGGKYATNFSITSGKQRQDLQNLLGPSVIRGMADRVMAYITESEPIWRGLGFYGSDFPLARLTYVLVPTLLYAVSERRRETSSLLPKQRPPRKDGGNGWFIVSEGIEHMDDTFSGCNVYSYDSRGGQSGKFVQYWLGGTFDEGLRKTLCDARFFLDAIGPGHACLFANDEDAARALQCGLCSGSGSRLYPAIPVFAPEAYQKLERWARDCGTLDAVWDQWLQALYRAYKSFTPKRLADQIGGNVDGFALNANAYILKQLMERQVIERPEEDAVFTKNLLLVR